MKEIADTLRKFVQENFLFGQQLTLDNNDSLLEHGIVDSTGVLELESFIERQYGIKVLDHELVPENLDSIANLTRFIQDKLAEIPARYRDSA